MEKRGDQRGGGMTERKVREGRHHRQESYRTEISSALCQRSNVCRRPNGRAFHGLVFAKEVVVFGEGERRVGGEGM